jgi:hypothetical protein
VDRLEAAVSDASGISSISLTQTRQALPTDIEVKINGPVTGCLVCSFPGVSPMIWSSCHVVGVCFGAAAFQASSIR